MSDARELLYRNNVSGGADKMVALAEYVVEEVNDIDLDSEPYPEDMIHEIVDGMVPVYNAEILETISEDPSLWSYESELGPAFDGTPTPVNIAAGVIYEVLYNVAASQLCERQAEAEEV